MILRPPSISTNQFNWCPKTKTFSQEISSIPSFDTGRVFDDSCDEGFTLVSHKTLKEVVMCLYETKFNGEGELQSWEFRPIHPRNQDFVLIIFND
jgi:hypothetical protein